MSLIDVLGKFLDDNLDNLVGNELMTYAGHNEYEPSSYGALQDCAIGGSQWNSSSATCRGRSAYPELAIHPG